MGKRGNFISPRRIALLVKFLFEDSNALLACCVLLQAYLGQVGNAASGFPAQRTEVCKIHYSGLGSLENKTSVQRGDLGP